MLVVDYDLVMVDPDNARHTGEELARMCRLFSKVGYIIILNQFNREVDFDFDLRMHRHPASHADLNIAARTIGQEGLWRPVASNGFKPWHWDDIEGVSNSRMTLAADLARTGLSGSIADHLGVPDAAILAMPDTTFEYLDKTSLGVDDFRRTTFLNFLRQQVEGKELPGMAEWNAERASCWAVSRTGKWLSRMLLGPQDILIDIPHLIDRLPFLMDPDFGDVQDPKSWHRLVHAGPEAISEPVRSHTRFADSMRWLGRATFWWPLIEEHEYVQDMRARFSLANLPNLVFAEDRSRFVDPKDAVEFRNDDPNRFRQRWVSPVPGLIYEPRRRLLEY